MVSAAPASPGRLRLQGALAAGMLLLGMSCGSSDSSSRAREQDSPASGSPRMEQDAAAGGDRGPAGRLPGALPHGPALLAKLRSAWASRSPEYRPRTRHLQPDGSPTYTNRLFLETSPYLKQHAHNPVDWYPWGDEAFETAKELSRPVLLSVGYSTCHWCHVMEEESFEDEEIARYLNESYIAIKVDREERPDVDAIYMNAVQMMTGRGGWPMTVWLTPAREPFYGGTYFPARDGDRGAGVGFLTLLRRLRGAYDQEPSRVTESATRITRAIEQNLAAGVASPDLPGPEILHAAFRHYEKGFDSDHGGLAGAPKFPSSLPVRFLLRYHRRTGNEKALEMATLTLAKMAAGGIHDQIGGGFHRYSTDERWLVPHFEKMLYDNALLAAAYLEGYQASGREDFARIARDILEYVEREMTTPEGGFYSATDADSPTPGGRREEGWFFTWTPAEIKAAVGRERARLVEAYYAVTEAGNFEGRNVLQAPRPLDEVAGELGLRPEEARSAIDDARRRLYAARAARPAPHRDEKILAAWNGLMISGFARGALALGEERYAQIGERAADFLLARMRREGRLLRSYKDGQGRFNAYLDDHAFVIAGLLDLYEATGGRRWLEEAIALDRVLEEFYEDKEVGGFFMVSRDHESLLAREKPAYDGAEPSGNSVQALNLLRLLELTTGDRYRVRAERTLRALGARLAEHPAALSEMLLALDFHLDTPLEVVIVTASTRKQAEPLLAQLRSTFVPNRILAVVGEGAELESQAKLVPLAGGKVARDGVATAYVCEAGVCELPTTDPDVFARQIRRVKPLPGGGSGASPSGGGPAPR